MKLSNFVPFEESLKLKNLGFNENCFAHYNPNGVFFWKILCSDEDNDHTLSVKDIMEHSAIGYIEAPFYFQAFNWFRSMPYDFSIFEKFRFNDKFYGGYVKERGKLLGLPFGSNFVNYQDAEFACLKELIKFLENKV
jgi:hypothetical protein